MAVKIIVRDSDRSFLLPDSFDEEKENLRELVDNTFSEENLFGRDTDTDTVPGTLGPTVDDLMSDKIDQAPGAPVSLSEETSDESEPTQDFSENDLENLFDGELADQEPGVTLNDGFEEALDTVFEEEGGFVDDPNDKGGATNFGVTFKPNKTLLKTFGIKSEEDMKNLTAAQAKEVYLKNYWIPSKAAEMPEEIRSDYFTAYINNEGIARKALQRAIKPYAKEVLGDDYRASDFTDGIIGKNTLTVLEEAADSDPQLGKAIKYQYIKALAGRGTWEHHGNGWANRYLETNEFGGAGTDLRDMNRAEVLEAIAKFKPTIQLAMNSNGS